MLSAAVHAKVAQGAPLRDAADEVGGEHRGDDDRGVARVGEVVHGPAEHLALAHAGVQGGLGKQGQATLLERTVAEHSGAALTAPWRDAASAGGAAGGRRRGRRCPAPPVPPRGRLPISSEFTSASKRSPNSLSISATTPPSSAPSKWRSIRLTTSSHQQVALHLHDRGGVGADEQHQEVVARLFVGVALFLVEVGVVEGDLERRALLGQLVERHAHLVERLAEILVAGHRPADLEHVLLLLEADARLFLVDAGRAIGQRLGAGVFPERLERFLDLLEAHIGAQRHVAVHMDFEGSVVARHVVAPLYVVVPGTGVEPVRPFCRKRRILSPLCLPISPSGRPGRISTIPETKTAPTTMVDGAARSISRWWRRDPESNRARRICNPLHNRFAIAPCCLRTELAKKREA